MSKIIELAHLLGDEIAKSEEMKELERTKIAFSADAELQAKMREYEADQLALGQEFSKDPDSADQRAIADIRARMQELSAQITANENYAAFAEAQRKVNAIMRSEEHTV